MTLTSKQVSSLEARLTDLINRPWREQGDHDKEINAIERELSNHYRTQEDWDAVPF